MMVQRNQTEVMLTQIDLPGLPIQFPGQVVARNFQK